MLSQDINWEDKFKGKNVTKMTDIFLHVCESSVKKIFKKKDDKKDSSSESSSSELSSLESSSSKSPSSEASTFEVLFPQSKPEVNTSAQCGKRGKKF